MLYPINFTNNSIKSTQKASPSHTGKEKEYKDPLANQWLNVVLYSTELGALVHEISPKTARALWIPTIMYLGADIYDKYKNDDNKFAPSGKRGVEQAIYQGVAGFLLPAAAIRTGQLMTSPVGKLVNKGISVNAKEQTLLHIKSSLDQCVGKHLKNYENFENFILTSLQNKITATEKEKQADGFFKKTIKYTKNKFALNKKNSGKVLDFAKENIKELYGIKTALEKGIKPDAISNKIYKQYLAESSNLRATFGKDYANDALRYALKSYQNQQLMKNKLIKTFGGIVALAVTLKPIYNYVQKTFIPKFVDPNLDRFNRFILDSSALRQHIKDESYQTASETSKEPALFNDNSEIEETLNNELLDSSKCTA